MPAAIVHDAALSNACAKHNAYGRINRVLTHSETPSLPGYTLDGNQAAGLSVLYQGSGPWSANRNPFESAPIHLHQLLAPRLDRMGASENQGYGCATTLASRNRAAPAGDVTYTYPGNGARRWPASQVASEGPYTPGQRVGIPAGTKTGPYLYVMFDGPDLTPFDEAVAADAKLTGPAGKVSVAVVHNRTSGLQGFLPTGIEVIPRAPLRRGATYTSSVAANVTTQGGVGPARTFRRTWSFTTTGRPFNVSVRRRIRQGSRIKVTIKTTARFSLRFKLRAPGGRTLVRRGRHTLAGGVKRTYRLRVARRYNRRGRKVRLAMVIVADGKRYTVNRTIRFH